jgi:hypothetical protein
MFVKSVRVMHNARFKFEISRKPIKNIISGDLEAQDPLAAARAETRDFSSFPHCGYTRESTIPLLLFCALVNPFGPPDYVIT